MSTSQTSLSKRRSSQQWQAIIERFDQSNLSGAQFCRDNHIAYASFCKWRHKLSRSHLLGSAPSATPDFIDLSSLSQPDSSGWHIVLKLGDGLELCLSQSHVSS